MKGKIKNIVIWATGIIVALFVLFGGGYAAIKSGLDSYLTPVETSTPAD